VHSGSEWERRIYPTLFLIFVVAAMNRCLLLAFLVCIVPDAVWAQPHTCAQMVNGLQGMVRYADPSGQIDYTDYNAILLGVSDTHPELCVPPGIQAGVLKEVFLHWADANPKLMTMDAWACATRAFSETWPCTSPQQFHKG
jgi:hypothetical protein